MQKIVARPQSQRLPAAFAAAAVMLVLGLVCAQFLRPRPPADAAARPDVKG